MYWVTAMRKVVVQEHPGLKQSEVMKICGERWTKATPEEKQPYVNMNVED